MCGSDRGNITARTAANHGYVKIFGHLLPPDSKIANRKFNGKEFFVQRTEDRGQRTEDRGQRTEDRGQKLFLFTWQQFF
ncbi:hypothetical protein BES34_018350 [Leptospira inadai serovar Lyme]|uniref:Uncharacterized protein n=1 Tax=Leptospira inadai serovar Lyme TaxID=293084 RepID=A0ABX4YEA9_9LEPT|nr:hypothetical protein BES34_018350 [Leptospira inadai serovar Lyme]